MAEVLVDSDIFVDHLRGFRPFAPRQGDRAFYSVVTRAELFAGRGAQEDTVRRLLAPFTEIPVDREIAERAGTLRRGGSVTMADALIAATALERSCVLLTRNARHFEGIRGLRLHSPA